jgi:hypothetical protein
MGIGIGTALSIGGAALGFMGSKDASKAQKAEGKRRLAQGKEQNRYNKAAAIQTEASGQIAARDIRRQTELVASRAIAVAAAGGYSDDITNLLADIDGEGNYRASIELYNYGTEAERLRHEGRLAEKYGSDSNIASQAQAKATKTAGYGNLLSNAASIYNNWT